MARDYARRGCRVPPERIVLTASTSEAYGCLFKLLGDAGDEVLVPRPSYPLFEHLTRLERVTRAALRSRRRRAAGASTSSRSSAALTPRTRAVLVVSPNNPTGSFVKPDELERLAELAADREMALIADEVFADYELAPGARAAAGRVVGPSRCPGVLPRRAVEVDRAAAGEARMDRGRGPRRTWSSAALERLELICDTYLSVSTPVQVAAADLLERGRRVRAQIARPGVANYRAARRSRRRRCRPAACFASDGGWYAVIQVPSLESEEALVVELSREDGVLVHPGYFFDFPRESFLVVSLLAAEAQFADGIDRVLRRFERAGWRP